MNPNQKSNIKPIVCVGLLIYVIAMFFAVEYSAYSTFYPQLEFKQVFGKMLTEMPENQFYLPAAPKNIFVVGGCFTIIFGLFLWWAIAEEKANEHAAFGKEYGSAQFLKKIDAYSHKYADEEALYSEPGVKIPFSYKWRLFINSFKKKK